MATTKQEIYFERQGMFSNNCAVHTVNNLIGFPAFCPKTFDAICSKLQIDAKFYGFTTKSRHMMGGDYDINVIQKALQNLGLETTWVDSRINYQYKYQEGTYPKGYILNFQSEDNLFQKMLSYSNRHWICVKLQNTDYYMLDSKKSEPVLIEDIDHFVNRMKDNNCQILEVRGRIRVYQKQPVRSRKVIEPSLILQNEECLSQKEQSQQTQTQNNTQQTKECKKEGQINKQQKEDFLSQGNRPNSEEESRQKKESKDQEVEYHQQKQNKQKQDTQKTQKEQVQQNSTISERQPHLKQ